MADTTDDVLQRVARRYAGASRFTRGYVAIRLARDPVHRAVLDMARRETFGAVLDVGCGRGQLSLALLEARLADSAVGVDWDAVPLAEAALAAEGLAFSTIVQDLAIPRVLPQADTILMSDVLYQLDTDAQDALLHQAARAARARIVIRTLDPNRGLRSRVALTAERLMRGVWPTAGACVNARSLTSLTAALNDEGFLSTVVPCWRGTPFANVLMVARRSRVRAKLVPG